ncbi:hypothetical protein [Flaviaesturariibacter amylovorans]|uniref:Uncharacterized protein n=1 Tax=Flaviaesturariibacter amylovorans TaxID=1084520 RepID=A0ABP8HDE4_9BACT
MPYWLQHTLSFSILFPVLVGILRYRQLDARYLPFLLLMWIGFANEQVSYVSGKLFRTNAPNSNLWFLAEALLCLWCFYRWRLFRKPLVPCLIGGAYVLFWAMETFLLRSILDFSVYFHICYAFATVLMAIQYINKLIVTEQQLSIRHGDFTICTALVIFNTGAVFSECFWLYAFTENAKFGDSVFLITTFANFFTNIMYGFALLWVPRRQVYLQLS